MPPDTYSIKSQVLSKLTRMLERVDGTPVTRQQKLKLYQVGICPRMSWDLAVNNPPLLRVTGTPEATVTRFLKRWSGIAKTTDTVRLYLPQFQGSLNLPPIFLLYKKQQVSQACQLVASKDTAACEVHYHSRDQERRGTPAGNPLTNVGSTRHPCRRPRHEQASTDDKSQVSYGERGC